MKHMIKALAILSAILATAGCLGPDKTTSTPDPNGVGQLNIVINRPGSMGPQALSPMDHDAREHFLRIIAWKRGSEYVKVMKDVKAEEYKAGEISVDLNLPLRFGYRVMAVEWVERSSDRIANGAEPVYLGVTEPVDVLTSEPVVVTINLKSVGANPPQVYLPTTTVTGGDLVQGSISVPNDFKFGGFHAEYISTWEGPGEDGAPPPSEVAVCFNTQRKFGYQAIDNVPPVRVDWNFTAPILQQDDPISCTFEMAVEVLDARPEGALGSPPGMFFWTEPITVTIMPPSGGISF